MAFSSIPDRVNGQRIVYGWFNLLRDEGSALAALITGISSFLGGGYLAETNFTVANNQSSASNVTGLSFSSSTYKGALIFLQIRRSTSGGEVVAVGKISAIYRNDTSSWELIETWDGDDCGVTLSITAAGQVQYTSTNLAGTGYAGTMRFKALSFNA